MAFMSAELAPHRSNSPVWSKPRTSQPTCELASKYKLFADVKYKLGGDIPLLVHTLKS